MDIRVIIQKGLIYTSLLVLIVGLYLALIFVFGYFFQKTTDVTVLLSAGLTTIIGIFGVPIIDKYLRNRTDKIFFKGKYDYSQAMKQLSETLREGVELRDLTDNISDRLKQILRTDSIKFSFFEKEERENKSKTTESRDDNAGLIVPIILKNEVIGTINIAQKLSGDTYTDEDIRLLETFATQAAIALERVRLYGQVKKHSLELEEKVQQRTAQIKELQKGQEQIMIDISHGLQNPLTVVKGELESLKNQMKDDQNLIAFEKSVDEISKLIYDLLNLARLDTNIDDFKKESVDLSKLLDEVVEYFEITAKENNIVTVKNIQPNISILGDKKRLEELVTNLLSNSIKYIANERKIFIELQKLDDSISITIKDTGIGIDKNDLPNIFSRFYRAKNSDQSNIKGTGLGLAICKKIVEKHNGTITVESKKDKDTTFTIIFHSS